MPKNLNDVLKGVRKSTINKLTTGENPGVDYADKSKDTRDFLDQHSVEKHEDRVGNGDDVYKASGVKKASMERHGHEPKPKDIKVYNKTNQTTNEEAKDPKEYGYEGDMAMTQLKSLCRNAENIMKMVKPSTDLPEWVQSKITKAEDYISTANDYLSSEMKEEVKVLDEGYNKSNPAHVAVKKLSTGWKRTVVKPEYHDDGSASIHSKGYGDVSSTTVVDNHLKDAGGMHNYSEKELANHTQKIGKLNFQVKKTSEGHSLLVKEETKLSEAKCNMSEAGKMCETHGMKACPKEDSKSAENEEPRFTGKKDPTGKTVLITDKKQIQEKLTKKTPIGKIIKDVENSEDPRFKGDSKEKRKEKALAIWYKMHPEKSNKVDEGVLDQRSKKSTGSEEARKKMSSEIAKKNDKAENVEIKKKEKLFDSDLRKQEMVFSHKLKNGKVKGKIKEQSAPADTSITFPATNSREGLKV